MSVMISLPTACKAANDRYQRAYHCIVAGAVPAVRSDRGWEIAESDIPALAAAVASRPTRKTAAAA